MLFLRSGSVSSCSLHVSAAPPHPPPTPSPVTQELLTHELNKWRVGPRVAREARLVLPGSLFVFRAGSASTSGMSSGAAGPALSVHDRAAQRHRRPPLGQGRSDPARRPMWSPGREGPRRKHDAGGWEHSPLLADGTGDLLTQRCSSLKISADDMRELIEAEVRPAVGAQSGSARRGGAPPKSRPGQGLDINKLVGEHLNRVGAHAAAEEWKATAAPIGAELVSRVDASAIDVVFEMAGSANLAPSMETVRQLVEQVVVAAGVLRPALLKHKLFVGRHGGHEPWQLASRCLSRWCALLLHAVCLWAYVPREDCRTCIEAVRTLVAWPTL
jgi:hypothetical protein